MCVCNSKRTVSLIFKFIDCLTSSYNRVGGKLLHRFWCLKRPWKYWDKTNSMGTLNGAGLFHQEYYFANIMIRYHVEEIIFWTSSGLCLLESILWKPRVIRFPGNHSELNSSFELPTTKPLIKSSFLLGGFASDPSGWSFLRCRFGLLRFRRWLVALHLGRVRPWTGAWRGSRLKLGVQREKDIEWECFVQLTSSWSEFLWA